jgi:hypothetical protein
MKFGTSLLQPSYTRQPHFKAPASGPKSFDFECVRCHHKVTVDFDSLIKAVWNFEEALGEDAASQAKQFYGIGLSGKSQDGGWPAVVKRRCENCQAEYLIYAGVNEVYNSLHNVTVQGVTEILE